MNKKTIAYVLIALVGVGVVYYLFGKKSDPLASAAPPQTPFEADDEAAYQKVRNLLSVADRNWVDELAKNKFNTNPSMVGGKPSKAQTYSDVIGSSAPNVNGKYPAKDWSGGKPLLWDDNVMEQAYWIPRNALNKYGGL